MQTSTQDTSPAEMLFKLWPWIEANKARLIGFGVVVVAACGIVFFMSSRREQRAVDAGRDLTTLLVSAAASGNSAPQATALMKLAEQYSGTPAGVRAKLQAGASLFDAGNYADAEKQFQACLAADVSGPLTAVAQMGLAASMDAQNKTADAAAAYQRVITAFPNATCNAVAYFALGCIAERQNKLSEARDDFEKAARSSMGNGSMAKEAEVRASELEVKLAAAKPAVKPVATPAVPQPITKP